MKSPGRSWLSSPALLAGAVLWSLWLFLHYFDLPRAGDCSFLKAFFSDLAFSRSEKFFATWLLFLKNFLGTVLLGAVFVCLGSRITSLIGLGAGNLTFPVRIALGALATVLCWTGLGFNGLWQEGFLKLLLIALSLWALVDLRGRTEGKILPFAWRSQDPGTKGWMVFGGFFGLTALAMGAAPDVFYDGLVYHLFTLQTWLDHHGICDIPTNLYTYYPFGGETFLFNGYLFGGSEAAKLLEGSGFILLGMTAGFWAAEEAGVWAGAATWVMVMAFPLFHDSVWTSRVDVLLALLALLFLYSLWRASQGRDPRWFLAAGIFAGAALSVKYTAGIGLLLSLAVVFALGPEKRWGRGWIGMGLIAALLGAPWAIKNLVFRGDPLYPYPFLGWGGMPAENLTSLMYDHQASWMDHPSLWEWFSRVATQDLDKTTAPLVLGLLPLLFFWKRIPSAARVLWVLGGLWLVVGFAISHQPRLSIPAFLVLLTAAGMSLGSLSDLGWKRWASFLVLVFGFLSLLSLGRTAFRYYRIDQVWMGVEGQEDYLLHSPQTSAYFPLSKAVKGTLPGDKRLLILGDARALYYPNPVVANTVYDPQLAASLAERTPDEIHRSLREMGVDALVVSGVEGTRVFGGKFPYAVSEDVLGNWGVFRTRWLQTIYSDGKSGVFLLRESPVP